MKRALLAFTLLMLCIALVACVGKNSEILNPVGEDTTIAEETFLNPDDGHEHVNKPIAAVNSTCTQAGLSEGVVCVYCNMVIVEQTPTPLAPHNYVEGVCKVCGATSNISEGLSFATDGDGNYIVDGVGTCTDTQVVIPNSRDGKPVVAIAPNAFADNETIVQVIIPSNVKKIGNNAFNRCVNLSSVVLNEGLESIGEKAFMYCDSLKTIIIPNSVKTIQTGAFMACYNLVEVTLGAGLDKIANDLFFECDSLEVVDISSKLTSVGGWSFYGCNTLTTINYVGTDNDWNSLKFGDFWDENSGLYNVFCAGDKSIHKHIYGEWYELGVKCEWSRKCTKCTAIQKKYKHDSASAQWTFTSEGVIHECKICKNAIKSYMKSDVILALDFDVPVAEQIADYPYFRIVSDTANQYEKDGNRSVWAVNSTTWVDYDKRAFEDLSYYSITFDMKVSGNPEEYMRDNSVISFVPGTGNGVKIGSIQKFIWQIKYIPLLGKLSTKPLNGTDIPYTTVDSIPDVTQWNSTNSADLPDNKWVTVDVVCDIEANLSYIFVDGKPIGSVATFDYSDTKYNDAFAFRFCDVTQFGTKFDNFKIQAMTANQ